MEIIPKGPAAEFNIYNAMEKAVIDQLETVMKDFGSCLCENCQIDVLAATLNTLPPKYIATRRGEIFTNMQDTS